MRQVQRSERQHPIFSPVAIISALILITLLSLGMVLTGGRMFSPGELSAANQGGQPIGQAMSHAEVGDNCVLCHAPFKGISADLCQECHEDVARQREQGKGIHGRINPADKCGACHTEHIGEGALPLVTVHANFNHELTRFSLTRHERDYSGATAFCKDCHLAETEFAAADAACTDCHQQADPAFIQDHVKGFGEKCSECHDGLDTMAEFTQEDHAQVFALVGGHVEVTCSACHSDGVFEGTSHDCATCHEEPEVHAGLFVQDCAACHTEQGWKPAQWSDQPFNHDLTTRFSLVKHAADFDGTALGCKDCHGQGERVQPGQIVFSQSLCSDCHRKDDDTFMTEHIAQFGEGCLGCHDGSGDLANFDHSQVWPLEGKHAVTACTSCHNDKVFAGTSRECVACHEEPAIHLGLFGTTCDSCHTAEGWRPARLIRHTFPLNHGRDQESDCTTCHTGSYSEYTCYNCHEHEPTQIERKHQEEGIVPPELANCVKCHPTGREGEGGND